MKVNASWITNFPTVAPVANTVLVSYQPNPGRVGLVYGVRINSQEANAAGKVWAFGLSNGPNGPPTIVLFELDVLNPLIDSNVPLWMTFGGPTSVRYIVSNTVAGTAATRHQAWLKIAEVDLADLVGSLILGT